MAATPPLACYLVSPRSSWESRTYWITPTSTTRRRAKHTLCSSLCCFIRWFTSANPQASGMINQPTSEYPYIYPMCSTLTLDQAKSPCAGSREHPEVMTSVPALLCLSFVHELDSTCFSKNHLFFPTAGVVLRCLPCHGGLVRDLYHYQSKDETNPLSGMHHFVAIVHQDMHMQAREVKIIVHSWLIELPRR